MEWAVRTKLCLAAILMVVVIAPAIGEGQVEKVGHDHRERGRGRRAILEALDQYGEEIEAAYTLYDFVTTKTEIPGFVRTVMRAARGAREERGRSRHFWSKRNRRRQRRRRRQAGDDVSTTTDDPEAATHPGWFPIQFPNDDLFLGVFGLTTQQAIGVSCQLILYLRL